MHNTGVPQVLAGRFRLESLLGSGGMGAVYAATDTAIGRRVAIKMLHPEVALQRDSLERMREEAVSLASLHHPNIVQLFDFYAGGPDSTFLVMELVEGRTLTTALRTRVPFPVDAAIDYAQQMLSALAAAHALGIFHRDIKPANVLVVPLPARHELIKIIDFGIAKLTEETIRRRPTTAGVLLGTPTYMAPEQTVGGAIDGRTDVYAVGVLLYRMLAGGNPFEGGDLAATLRRVATHVPTELSRVRIDVPDHVSRAVMRALAKDPAARFASAVEFAHALAGDFTGHALVVRGSEALVARQGQIQPGATGLHVSRTATTAIAPAAAADKPRRSGLGFGFGLGVAVALATSVGAAAVWLLSAAPSTPLADAAAPPSLPPPTDASTAATTASAPVASSAAPMSSAPPPPSRRVAPKPSAGARGTCACYPVGGRVGHGGNQRLSQRASPPRCSCLTSANELCLDPIAPPPCPKGPRCENLCKERRVTATPGASCTGFDGAGVQRTGVAGHCFFTGDPTLDEFPGPSGQPCKGFNHFLERVDGTQRCPTP